MLLPVSCKERKLTLITVEGEVLGIGNEWTGRCLSLSLRSMHDLNTLLPLWFEFLIDACSRT